MINEREINWISDSPYKIFEVNDFLKDSEFDKLDRNFPDFENIRKEHFFQFENNKFGITSGSKEYDEIILKNEVLRSFHEFINGDKFKKLFFFRLYKHILFSRNFNFKHMLKTIKIPKFVDKIESNFFQKNLTIFSKYKIKIQYSYILNNGMIVPHPDAGDKLLTLLLFFPQHDKDIKFKKKEIEFGTTFWKSSFINDQDKHLASIEEQKKFKNSSKILHKAEFIKNNLFGFIKNEHSWHSVEPIDVYEGYVRKSININIYY
jgi:hypothetical protein